MIAPPIGPTTRPPSSPIRKAPSRDKSANAYGGPPTSRRVTPTNSAGVRNTISLSFWSGSRCSVKSTRRKVVHRASNAAMDDATPTFSSRVNSRSRMGVTVSIFGRGSQANASQSAARCKACISACCSRLGLLARVAAWPARNFRFRLPKFLRPFAKSNGAAP